MFLVLWKHSFFFNDTATTEIYTLSLHDALPISMRAAASRSRCSRSCSIFLWAFASASEKCCRNDCNARSEEHTSELQSHLNLVCRLLLEKKKHFLTTRRTGSSSACV